MTKVSQPILVAHRGYSGRYPENTLLAYQAAYAHGGRWMECDIQLSADRVPIVHHDASLLRMTGVDEDIRCIPAKQLKTYSAHYPEKFGDEFQGNRLTKLKPLARWLGLNKDTKLFVEIKQESIDVFGAPVCMDEVFKRIKKVQQQCVIISFNDDVIDYARKTTGMEIGWVIPEWSTAVRDRVVELQPEYLFTNKNLLPNDQSDWWQGAWTWAIYNSDTPEDALAWAAKGISVIETNELGPLRRHEGLQNAG